MGASRRSVASITAAVAALLCWAPAAAATARFAAPEGSGTACTQPAPCDIATAITKSAANDDVTVETGTYGPEPAFMSDEHTLTIHGQAGAPRPVIIAVNGGIGLTGAGSSLRDVEVDLPAGNVPGLFVSGLNVTVERVLIHSLGTEAQTCIAQSAFTMRDSICEADGTKAFAFEFESNAPVSATLRNDTLEAPGGSGPLGGTALITQAFSGQTVQTTLINTIAHGAKVDLLAEADINASSNAVINAEHSNFATDNAVTKGGKASVTPHGTGTNQTAAPLFANAGTDDFHELAGSPTIGAGFSSPANGLTDLDGVARQFGGITDIGAYQFVGPPTCQASSATTAFGAAVALQLQCSDPLGAPLTSYAIVTAPAHGTAALNAATGAVTYTPTPGYSGPDVFTFDATGSHGTSAPATATITVAAAAVPAGAAAAPVALAPTDSQPVLAPTKFAALARGASVARTARGTTITYTDTQAATTTFTVRRQIGAGVLSHGRCVAPPHGRATHGKRCTRFTTLGSFAHADVAGPNRFRFTGRLHGRALRPGSYQLLSAPTNTAGRTGASHTNTFKIVAG